MSYEMKPLACNPASMDGLSEKIIVSHYENNYGGAVKRLNAIGQKLAELGVNLNKRHQSSIGFCANP